MLTCTDCEENFNTNGTLKRHKYERHCKKCTITATVEAALFNERTKTTKKRNYDTAVLNACGALLFEKPHQEMVLKVVSSVNLKPVSMVNSDGEEFNVLAHESQFQQIQKNDIQSASVVAKKRLIDNEHVEIEVELDDVLTKGVYRNLFNSNEFQEPDEEMCTLLNTDWSTKNKAILVICHEVYGRTRSVDVHREDFTVKSKQQPSSSLPPPRSPYRNIWVTTIIDNHGSKLIFGTKTFNSLVTSSIRIDSPYEPEVGPSTHHFTISSNEHKEAYDGTS
ncbi:hypothetical protein G6F23_012211 [Rhizopus arrhizus]|nr:hypothetical protein G6F23_012211 [Rhizopus arrhizus]